MRIVFVIDRLMLGGAENVFIDLVNRFYSTFKFDIITITHFDDNQIDYFSGELANDLRIFSIKRNSRLSLSSAYQLHKTLKNYDIVHSHLRHTYRYIAWVRKFFLGKYKIVLHDHEGSIYLNDKLPSWDYFLIKPDFYIGVCQKLEIWAIQKWRLNKYEVVTLINLPNEAKLFRRYSEKGSNKRLIAVGNIKPIKNQAFLGSLMIDLDMDLTIYGNNQNSDYFNEVNSYSRIKIIENVDISVDEISSYRLGLYSSKSESGPLVLLEYILAEIPFLAYQVGGMADAIAEFFPEYFIDNFDKAEWKLRILKLLEVPFNVELHRQKVNEMMIKYFSAENYKNELYKIYNGLMKC